MYNIYIYIYVLKGICRYGILDETQDLPILSITKVLSPANRLTALFTYIIILTKCVEGHHFQGQGNRTAVCAIGCVRA